MQEMRASAMLNFLNELFELMLKGNLWAAELIITILRNMIPDGNYLNYHNYVFQAYECCARGYTGDGRLDDAITALENAWKHVQAYDRWKERGEKGAYTAPLMDRLTVKNWPQKYRSAQALLQNLQKPWTVPLREREEFCRIEAECRAFCSEKGQ